MGLLNGLAIANIVRAEIVTEEATPITYVFDTASDAGLEAFVSEGKEEELRVKDRIISQYKTEDIIKGYNLTMKDVVFIPEVFALIDGGKSVVTGDKFESYTGPRMGEVTKRTLFTLHIYTQNNDYSGEPIGFQKFSFLHCKGAPAKFNLQDGQFMTPEYTIRSRPGFGESALSVTTLPELPPLDVPDEPEEGGGV